MAKQSTEYTEKKSCPQLAVDPIRRLVSAQLEERRRKAIQRAQRTMLKIKRKTIQMEKKIEQLEGVRILALSHGFDYTASYQVAAHNRHLRTDV